MKKHITIGMDLGDKYHIGVVFDRNGQELEIAKIMNCKTDICNYFAQYKDATVAIEAGTHSPWISRMLGKIGCTVYVGNPRKLRFIWDSDDKSDERDARMLGLVCRIEPRLLKAIRHRGHQAHSDLAVVKSRHMMVRTRTKLISHCRGVVKANGERLSSCSSEYFARRCVDQVPAELWPALEPMFNLIAQLTEKINELDSKIAHMCNHQYPETQQLQQVSGVGPVTALAYVLTIEDPYRFTKSRQLGPYLGLTPKRDQSGDIDKQLPISKAGNKYLRQLLVGSAHYILGPFGPDSHLRRHGLAIAARGGKNAKKRSAVAVARKLAVLLHRLWISGQAYEPLRGVSIKKAA